MELVTIPQFASLKAVNATYSAVRRAARKGILTTKKKGGRLMIVRELAVKEWAIHKKIGVVKRGRIPDPKIEDRPEDAPSPEDLDRSISPIATAQVRRIGFQSEIAELRVKQMRKELVRVEDVEQLWSRLLTSLRSRFLALPVKLRSRLSHLTTADVKIVDELVREALQEVSQEKHV